MKTFIVGDIHGCYTELRQLLESVSIKDEDLLVALGDIVDRGNQSKDVVNFLKNRPNTVILMGNHERKHLSGSLNYAQEIVKLQLGDEYDSFLSWIRGFPYFFENEHAIVIHAFFEHDKTLQEQRLDVLSGSTSGDRYLSTKYPEGRHWQEFYNGSKPIIYGHHVVGDSPEIRNNTWGIDTGACHGQYLSAIELPGFIVHQVKSKKDYWKEEQNEWQLEVLKSKDWESMEFNDIHFLINKLNYITETSVKGYLDEKKEWVSQLQNSIVNIKDGIDLFCQKVVKEHGENYKQVFEDYWFKPLLHKSKRGALREEDVRQALRSPNKVKSVWQALVGG